MARLRKNDKTVNTAPAAAAGVPTPVRHRAATPRKRSSAKEDATNAAKLIVPPAEPSLEPLAELATEFSAAPVVIVETIPETAAPAATPEPAAYTPSHEEISVLAYSYWVERNYAPGSPELDWLRAEAELSQRARPA